MNLKKVIRILFVISICLMFAISSYGAGMSTAQEVYVIPIKDAIGPAMVTFVQDSIKRAEKAGASAIVFDIDTLGGLVDSAEEISKAILATPIQTVAFVNRNAQSAGVLITISCDKIAMAPGSSIGAASTIPETPKHISYWKGRLVSVAKTQGRNSDYVAAMADKDIQIPGIVRAGEILSLDNQRALELGFIDTVAKDVNAVLEDFQIDTASIQYVENNFRMRLASFITNPYVSTILLTLAIVATVTEFFMPGFGVAGTLGLISFTLYFGGSYLAGSSNLTTIAIFIAGVVLLIIEAVAPGFGIPGIGGIACIAASIVLAAPSLTAGLSIFAISIIASIILLSIILRFVPKNKFFHKIVLQHSEKKEFGYVGVQNFDHYVGKVGTALTPLRPSD